jgi:hypothetical protein
MRIFSAQGVLCWEQKNPGQSIMVDTKSWQPGVYFLVWEAEGKVFGKKVVKHAL